MIDLRNYGTVTSDYGNRTAPTKGATTNHQGIDIVLFNDNVPAVVGGTVEAAGYNSASGNYVSIRDAQGNLHTYRHLASKSALKSGDLVKSGQTIGKQGSTGVSTGKHLHYDVKDLAGSYMNPETFFGSGGSNQYSGGGSQGSSFVDSTDGILESGAKAVISPVLKVVLCIIIFIGAAFFLMKAFDISLPSKAGLIKKGVEKLV